nr:hypothetical protein [Tanacetum cinerariifolium]
MSPGIVLTLLTLIKITFLENHREEDYQEGNNSPEIETLTYHVLATYGSKSLDQIHDRLQKLVCQLEIYGVSLSQEDVNLKFFRSFPFEWKTHTLIWRNRADLEEQSLDDLFNSLKIYDVEVKHSFSIGNITQNLAFVSSSNTNSTTDSVSATVSVSAVCAKMLVSSLPNVDSLSNAVIYPFFASQSTSPQLDNEDLKQIDVDDLEEMDLRGDILLGNVGLLRIQKGLSYQAEEEPANFALMDFSTSSFSSDTEVPFCSKACSKAYAQLHSQYEKLFDDFCKSQFDVISYQTGLESVKARLLVYKQSKSVFEENIKLLNIEVQLRDTALVTLRQKLEKAEQERDDLKLNDGYHAVPTPTTRTVMPPKPDLVFHTALIAVKTDHSAFTVQLSPTKPTQDLPHTNRPIAPIIEDWPVETSIPAATPTPASPKSNSSGKRRNRKACFVCKSVDHLIKDCDYHAKKMTQPAPRNYAHRGNHKQYASLTHPKPHKHMVPATVLPQSKPVSITSVRPVSAVVPKTNGTRPRYAHPIALVVSATQGMQGKWGNPQYALKNKGVIDSRCSRYITRNMSYLSNFEELNCGYVAFGGNPKGGKISGKGKIKTVKNESARTLTNFKMVKQKKDGIFISQDKYVAEILRKFRLTEGKLATTPIDIEKPLLKDPDGEDVDVHTYRVGKGFSRVGITLFKGMLVGQEIEEGRDTEEQVKDVTAGDAAQGDDTAAHGEVPIISQEPSIPSLTLPNLPPQPPQDLPSTSQVQHTPPQSPQA